MPYRSSVLVGRDNEVRIIDDILGTARSGRGSALFLVGESGIGKSRLANVAVDLGYAADMCLLRGRGSAIGSMVPFRSLTEALLSLWRDGATIEADKLGPYRPVLARLIPDLGAPAIEHDGGSLVILGEAVLRLTALVGQDRGCLLVLDDLQDADPETLAVVEYLIDNIERIPTALLGTIRDEPCAALDLARSAAQRGTGRLIQLDRLHRDHLRTLAGSSLDVAPDAVPDATLDLVWAGSAGNPFLAEELIGGVVDSGLLRREAAGWRTAEQPPSDLPTPLTRSVARRLDPLGPRTRDLLAVAATFGPRFPLPVVQAATGLADRTLLNHLHEAVTAHLVAPDDHRPDWYAFRHQMIGDAVLALLAPAERVELATRTAAAVDAIHPDLPGEWCQVSATLFLAAGDTAEAGRRFTDAGHRALDRGAAHSAVALLEKAWELLVGGEPAARASTLESLLYALAEAGLVERALAFAAVLDRIDGMDRRRKAQLHTRLAWVAAVAGRTGQSHTQLEAARALLGPEPAAEDAARVDVVAAHLALDVPGHGQLHVAEALARRAAAVTEAALPVVACQAWQLLGAIVRARDPDEATACLEKARSVAIRYDLPIWEIHALIRLGNDDALRDGTLDRLYQVRQQASLAGAVTAQYQAESSIALYTVLHGDFDAAAELIDRVITETTHLKLLETTQYLLVTRAVLAGHRGRRRDMDAALAQRRDWGGDLAIHAPRVYGLARAVCALLEEDRDRALDELSHALRAEDTNPTVFALAGRYGLHLLLRTLIGLADWSEYHELTGTPAGSLRWDRQFAGFTYAILAGRSGRRREAAAAVAEAMRTGQPYAMGRHLGLRLACEAALADGWGTPVAWLRTAEEYFHTADMPAVASACRAMLRRAGVRVAQRRSGAQNIPAELRSAGLTVREHEVLQLLADRLMNREIATRLHLSARTVEKHVSNLITKTGLPDRTALSTLATSIYH